MDAIVTSTPAQTSLRRHLPFIVVGAAVAVLGVFEALLTNAVQFGFGFEFGYGFAMSLIPSLVALVFGAAVAASRAAPGVALAIVWIVGALQLAGRVQIMFVQISVVVIAFACARWGSTLVQWASGLSIPIAALLIGLNGTQALGTVVDLIGLNGIVDVALDLGLPWRVVLCLTGAAILGIPWVVGFVMRASERVRASEASTAQAREEVARVTLEAQQAAEIARLQEERSQLALDVHDVVGHSLAVILAQAESAQFLPDDPKRLKETIATIATSARGSLQDVRHVLGGSGPAPRPLEVDVLLESARGAGFTVADQETGEPHPLPPELQTVAHRVLQEMLTNAIRHGSRKSPIRVSRRWPDAGESELVVEVSNATDASAPAEGGQGLDGMRRRLESVGGTLEVRPPARKGGRFTVVATIPVRDRVSEHRGGAADG